MGNELAERVGAALRRALGQDDADRWAYLACTSKPEHQVRDALAWQLHHELGDGAIVAREWHKRDLAILEADGRPQLVLEAKAIHALNMVEPGKGGWKDHLTNLCHDLTKARQQAPEATLLALVVVVHVVGPVPVALANTVKYKPQIDNAEWWNEDGYQGVWVEGSMNLDRAQEHIGDPIDSGYRWSPPTVAGEAFGLPVKLQARLLDVLDVPTDPVATPQRLPAPYTWTQLLWGYGAMHHGGVLVHERTSNSVAWLEGYADESFEGSGDLFHLWCDYLAESRTALDYTIPRRAWSLQQVRSEVAPIGSPYASESD